MTLFRGCVAGLLSLLMTLPCALPAPAQEPRWDELTAQVDQLYQQGKYNAAIPIAEEALKVAEATFEAENERVGTALSNLALFYSDFYVAWRIDRAQSVAGDLYGHG